jgi:hypothetical protein
MPVSQELGRSGYQSVECVVGYSVALAAQLAGERLLAEPAAILAGFGEDAGGSCDEAGIKACLSPGTPMKDAILAGGQRRARCPGFGSPPERGAPWLGRG